MKLPVICTLLVAATVGASQAGSFGGPGPWSNLSPLQSGIDGSYQATARGENLIGVIRFAYSGGVQSTIASANQYSIFVGGNVFTGGVTASITGKDLAGVLGGQDFTVPTNEDGGSELPLVFIVRGNRANGEFHGHLDLEDRMSAFKGEGTVAGAPNETNTVVLIPDVSITGDLFIGDDVSLVFTNVFEVPGGDLIPEDPVETATFKFSGVRTSVVAQGSGGTTPTTTN